MELASIIGLASSVFSLSKEQIKFVMNKVSSKILITPYEITTTSRHWDSTNTVVIQNLTNRPLFSVQIVCWHDEKQDVNLKFPKTDKKIDIKNIEINYGITYQSGTVGNEKIIVIEILRLLPNEVLEFDTEIHNKGKVRFFPTRYDEKQSKQVLYDGDKVAFPFTSPPFDMQIESTSFLMRKR